MNLLSKIKSEAKTTIFKNMTSLGVVQLANYAIPILIIPFVVRALGIEAFGKASYAQNIIAYLTILVNYGFEYSATQDVAINRDNKEVLRNIFWTVFRFKTLLLLCSFCALVVLYFSFSKVTQDPLLYFYAALINIGYVLFPTWFFQGMEKMVKMSIFNFIVKFAGALLTILLINDPTDYQLYILILSLTYVFIGICVFIYLLRKYELLQSFSFFKNFSKPVVTKGFPIFINNCFNTLYTTIGVTILGVYLTNTDVGLYSGIQKIIMAVIMLTCMPISVAFFPAMSKLFDENRQAAKRYFKKVLLVGVGFGICLILGIYILSDFAVRIFLGKEFIAAIPFLQQMSVIPCLVLIATILTVLGIYAAQMQKFAPLIGIFSGTVSLVVALIFIPKFGIQGAIYAWISAQVVEILFVSSLLIIKNK